VLLCQHALLHNHASKHSPTFSILFLSTAYAKPRHDESEWRDEPIGCDEPWIRPVPKPAIDVVTEWPRHTTPCAALRALQPRERALTHRSALCCGGAGSLRVCGVLEEDTNAGRLSEARRPERRCSCLPPGGRPAVFIRTYLRVFLAAQPAVYPKFFCTTVCGVRQIQT
jgi:hypothetical protein